MDSNKDSQFCFQARAEIDFVDADLGDGVKVQMIRVSITRQEEKPKIIIVAADMIRPYLDMFSNVFGATEIKNMTAGVTVWYEKKGWQPPDLPPPAAT